LLSRGSGSRIFSCRSARDPPRRFLAGADAISTAEQKIADLQADIESNRQLSTSLSFEAQHQRQ